MKTELEADLERAKIESETTIKVARIKANAELAIKKQEKKRAFWGQIYLNGVISGIIGLLLVLGVVGGITYKTVNENNLKAEQIKRCEAGGGVWTPRIQRVYDPSRSGEQHDEWYELCVK